MFENVSEKLKMVAKIVTALGVVCGILFTILSIINEAGLVAVLICISIPLDFYVFSLCLYALAGILKNTYLINQNSIEILKAFKKQDEQNEQKQDNYKSFSQNHKENNGSWTCENCDNRNPAQTNICMSCGKHR